MPRLFIMDDDQDLLTVLETLLVTKGFEVSTFNERENANEALKELKGRKLIFDESHSVHFGILFF